MVDLQIALLIVLSVLTGVAIPSAAIRVSRAYYVTAKMGWSDWFIVLAATCAAAMSTGVYYMIVSSGLGTHGAVKGSDDLTNFFHRLIVVCVFYFLTNMFVKLALCTMYLDLSREANVRAVVYVLIGLSIIFGLGSVISVIILCLGIIREMKDSVHGPSSPSRERTKAFLMSNAIIMITFDLFLYILPITITWGLQMSKAKRWSLRILFGLGLIVVASSCVRLNTVRELILRIDPSYNWGAILLTSAVENHLAVFIACTPALRAITMSHLYPKIQSVITTSPSTKSTRTWTHRGSASSKGTVKPLHGDVDDGRYSNHVERDNKLPTHYEEELLDHPRPGRSASTYSMV